MKGILTPLILFVALIFAGCNSDKDPVTPAGSNFSKAITVSEDGAPPYVLDEAQVGETLYRGTRASFRVSGKLQSGSVISLDFRQTSITTTGADKTDVVSAALAATTNATQASGTTIRNPATNTVTGSFSCVFANGKTIEGTIDELQLP